MKTVDNYKNFDIKVSKLGNYFAYSDRDLSEYVEVSLSKSSTIDEAKKKIDNYWKRIQGK